MLHRPTHNMSTPSHMYALKKKTHLNIFDHHFPFIWFSVGRSPMCLLMFHHPSPFNLNFLNAKRIEHTNEKTNTNVSNCISFMFERKKICISCQCFQWKFMIIFIFLLKILYKAFCERVYVRVLDT